ncbi:type VI secretion system [Burkholderia pseudomallei]|nr:type VI secretion system [Burkholderia pseudomallei]CAJ3018067.1 type VI secretion system [Burkholderia pseudomallei]CAJ4306262.1 type VI secretion system [Burkholderia pseudomallei]CAJ4931753.1 type VI secretion system [Burkholderia pseudomallei]CAJ6079361.1 type VI secretion system [Burkholderia pseudomallei]
MTSETVHHPDISAPAPTFDSVAATFARREPAPAPAGEPPAARLAAIRLARNPLLEAARVLLRALADMPERLDRDDIPQLRLLLEQEVRLFQRLCEQANIRRDHMLGARYCLCTALDEAAMQTSWAQSASGNLGTWISEGLATSFHEDRQGGDKVYLLIGRLMNSPHEHIDLLEVIYRILSLGFEGRYRYEADGQRKHETVRQRLYNEIASQRGPVSVALSPHWQPGPRNRSAPFRDFPAWVTAAVLSLIALGLFGCFKYALSTRSADVQQRIAAIARMAPPAAPAELRLATLLAGEIAAGTLSVEENARRSSVTFRGDAMFAPGAAGVNPAMGPLIRKIAAEIAKVPGKVTVRGYTDNQPIKSRQFASNEALSEERATQVMQMLQSAGVPASRLEALGKGGAEPIGDNRTPQGRALNRRVEITVAR